MVRAHTPVTDSLCVQDTRQTVDYDPFIKSQLVETQLTLDLTRYAMTSKAFGGTLGGIAALFSLLRFPMVPPQREFFIDNLPVRMHLIIKMISEDWPCAMGF